MKILLIAGHGANDPGAVGKLNGVTFREADETRAVVALVASSLIKQGVEVTVYDTDRNAFKDYQSGLLKSNARFADYDYVLEIHFNAVKASNSDGKTKGVECYVTTRETEIGVETAICMNMAAIGFTNRGVKRKNWAVITTAKNEGVSAALLEVCFIDDPDDMSLYTRNRQKVATAIVDGIVSGFNILSPTGSGDKPSAWAKTACEWAKAKGYFGGDGKGNYNWQDPLTREQLAAILYKMEHK